MPWKRLLTTVWSKCVCVCVCVVCIKTPAVVPNHSILLTKPVWWILHWSTRLPDNTIPFHLLPLSCLTQPTTELKSMPEPDMFLFFKRKGNRQTSAYPLRCKMNKVQTVQLSLLKEPSNTDNLRVFVKVTFLLIFPNSLNIIKNIIFCQHGGKFH